ncbi:MAG: hypothetical protein Q8P22_05645 [Chloroflexota bacterium]|nr:hypothetical protein [Chloroflexota bacterium]
MGNLVVYSIKVNPEHLNGAKRFFARRGLLSQDVLRVLIRMASRCESCLALVESRAPISEIQSAFASVLADAKETWQLNGLFQDTVLKTAEACNLPQDFIKNVLAEAQRIYTSSDKRREDAT